MVKRGIGAIVLAIIAALLLGWLLKDKSQERQDVVEMKLPGAPEMKIPSLTEPTPEEGSAPIATLVNETTQKVTNTATDAGSKVVAAVNGAASKAKDAITSTTATIEKTAKSSKPGFAIRPPNANEQREVVDNVDNTTESANQSSSSNTNDSDSKAKSGDTVVASTTATPKKVKKAFVPTIVEEKKKVIKKKNAPPKKVAKTPKQKKQKVEKAKPVVTATASAAPAGKYSVQLLATSSQSRANKLAQTMKEEGYKSFITQTSKNNKTLYRVRLGAHDNRSSALKAQQNLKRRYQKNFFVQNSLVVSN